jgi:hypothetical protein
MLPYTNQEANALSRSKFKHFRSNLYGGTRTAATHFIHSMVVSAKLLMASIASCVNGFIPSAFRYTTASVCLSIIEDDLQNNRMPIPQKQKQSTLNELELNDISMPVSVSDEDKLE